MPEEQIAVYADALDPGLRFILPGPKQRETSPVPAKGALSDEIKEFGGLVRYLEHGHFGAIVGRGGSGKSILALQLVTGLLNQKPYVSERPDAAFYFTLEASPSELARQIAQFTWGKKYGDWIQKSEDSQRINSCDAYSQGLYLISIPSPAESLQSVNLQIRQTIARQLPCIMGLAAIVIDPMGAINTDGDLRTSLSQLKELAEHHRTFVFLLTEKYVFEEHPSIEHYCQSIVHLEHDPSQQQHRRLYVQKARGQGFRSGYHQFELLQTPMTDEVNDASNVGEAANRKQEEDLRKDERLSKGIRVFPSIDAQSADAHELLLQLSQRQQLARDFLDGPTFAREQVKKPDSIPFFKEAFTFLSNEQIEAGSAIFLMGPPGTFKEYIAHKYATGAGELEATIYVSFKADYQIILAEERAIKTFDPQHEAERPLEAATYFFDARSPLLTPEEVLFTVRNEIIKRNKGDKASFKRAIIWGLRRLYDFPNFGVSRTVQFLEALVTFLKSQQITCLLVDWPDPEKTPSVVPIVDLCQYIFLTRVCFSKESPEPREEKVKKGLGKLWDPKTKRVALLRAQRTREGVHHDRGAVLKQLTDGQFEFLQGSDEEESFEYRWLNYGREWEKDLSLLS